MRLSIFSVLTKAQAEEQMDKLIGDVPVPRLWLELDEVPHLLDDSEHKSEALFLKNIFPRNGRLTYRNPDAAAAPGRVPNPRGAPARLTLQRFWQVMGPAIVKRVREYDWDAYAAYEAEVRGERDRFERALRQTIAFRQQRRRFCIASRGVLERMLPTTVHGRNSNAVAEQEIAQDAVLVKFTGQKKGTKK